METFSRTSKFIETFNLRISEVQCTDQKFKPLEKEDKINIGLEIKVYVLYKIRSYFSLLIRLSKQL